MNAGRSSLRGIGVGGPAFDGIEVEDRSVEPSVGASGGKRRREQPLVPLERDFSSRANELLRQFGYDAFRNRTRRRTPTTGAIYDSYRLGVGDEIIVILHGKNWQNIRIQIDRSGRIILPQLRPIVATGRTLGEFRAALRSDVKRTMLGTEVYVSIGKLRTVDVTVIGEVKLPGVYHLTGLSTLMDALIRAGGPNKSGSLRQIRINRGEKVRTIDLYDLFIQGGFRQDITLREGDRVLVPTIGPTIALAGHFKRPGIYELPPGAAPLLQSVVGYAGSPIRPRGNRFIRITVGKDGREEIREFRRLGSLRAGDGDVVIVQPGANIQIGGVWLEGEVRVPGRRSLGAARSVRQLIRDVKTLGKDAYLPFAVIRRLDAGTQAPIYLPVNLLDVLANRQDTLLRSADSFIVFHRTDIEFLGSADVQAVLNQAAPPSIGLASPGQEKRSFEDLDGDEDLDREKADADRVGRAVGATQVGSAKRAERSADGARRRSGLVREKSDKTLVRTDYACAGLRTLSVLIHNGSSARFANARRGIVTRRSSQVVNIVPCPTIFDRYPDLLAFVLDYVVAVDGEVLIPGIYPIASETSVTNLARIAGGPTREADLSKVEISRVNVSRTKGKSAYQRSMHTMGRGAGSAAAAMIGPGDSVSISPVFTQRENGPVLLSGEFRYPGLYRIRRGERLSQIVARAGGLTEQAYPFGAVFLRQSARRAQKIAFERAAEQLQITLSAQTAKAASGSVITAGESLIKRLKDAEPIGRVVIEADPTVLEARPQFDIVVEPGDRLVMPRRPTTVHVSGAVLNPGSMQFSPRTSGPMTISSLPGGFAESADDDRLFVIYPNGKARRLQVSMWNYEPVNIPPGSTIVVPPDPRPFELGAFLTEAAEIVSKLALTAALVAVVSR